MNFKTQLFSDSPLVSLSCLSILLIASGRLAFALVTAGGIVWVYVLSALSASLAQSLLPKAGRNIVLVFLTSFIAALFLLFLWFISPLLTMGILYAVLLIPCAFVSSKTLQNLENTSLLEALGGALWDALTMCIPLVGLALIREPLGYKNLSLPGGLYGVIELFGASNNANFLPVEILATQAGAFILLGYGAAIFFSVRRNYIGDKQ